MKKICVILSSCLCLLVFVKFTYALELSIEKKDNISVLKKQVEELQNQLQMCNDELALIKNNPLEFKKNMALCKESILEKHGKKLSKKDLYARQLSCAIKLDLSKSRLVCRRNLGDELTKYKGNLDMVKIIKEKIKECDEFKN